MNLRVLLRLLGIISFVVGGAMVFPLAWSVYYYTLPAPEKEEDLWPILGSMTLAVCVGLFLFVTGTHPKESVQRREAVAVVGLGWLFAAGLGALPFFLSGTVDNYVDGYFESMSGFTTTGSTILDDIAGVTHGILFWRSFIQWLGGMGIIVLFVAILPHLKASGKQLLYNEVPGPKAESLQPRIQDTAVLLWKLYVSFTIILVGLLMVEGMDLFDALCHSLTTMATGGFSPKADSIGHYDSLATEITIIVFMVIAGTNFGLYYRTINWRWGALFQDAEWRFYLFLLALATVAVVGDLRLNGNYTSVGEAARAAAFQTTSIMTTTGFGTADFDTWPSFSKMVLVVLMFVGGCAGSTGGGVKVIRILVIIKNALIATEHSFRPRAVRALRVGTSVVEDSTRQTILAFFTILIGTVILSSLALAAMGMDLISAASASATALNNVGPGLGVVGAVESFSQVPALGKILLSLLMVVGRLEVFAVIVLFFPGLWRTH